MSATGEGDRPTSPPVRRSAGAGQRDTATTASVGEIVARLARAAEAVGSIPKDDRNEEQGYAFRGIERILAAAGPALHAEGIVTVPRVLSMERLQRERGQRRNLWDLVVLTVEYRFVAPDGSSVAAVVAAEGMDNGDKATSKAMTMAYKSALLQVLAIGDDTHDADRSTPEDGPAQARQRKSSGNGGSARRSTGTRKRDDDEAQPAANRATREDALAWVAETHGPEHRIKVEKIMDRLDAIADKHTRTTVKQEFARVHETPVRLTPAQVDEAAAWLDEMLAPATETDAPGPEADVDREPSPPDTECECGADLNKGEEHLEGCPYAAF